MNCPTCHRNMPQSLCPEVSLAPVDEIGFEFPQVIVATRRIEYYCIRCRLTINQSDDLTYMPKRRAEKVNS